jgi:hypothetical protein
MSSKMNTYNLNDYIIFNNKKGWQKVSGGKVPIQVKRYLTGIYFLWQDFSSFWQLHNAKFTPKFLSPGFDFRLLPNLFLIFYEFQSDNAHLIILRRNRSSVLEWVRA